MRKMSNTKDVTDSSQDWEDFWYSPEKFGVWYPEDFIDDPKENIKFLDSI